MCAGMKLYFPDLPSQFKFFHFLTTVDNHFHNILRIFDCGTNPPFPQINAARLLIQAMYCACISHILWKTTDCHIFSVHSIDLGVGGWGAGRVI